MELKEHHCRVEASSQGFDQPPNCLINADDLTSKYCAEKDGENWLTFHFTRPIFFRAYQFVMGNDYEERDPVEWIVTVKDAEGSIKRMNDDFEHEERHSSYDREVPERHGRQNFVMCEPMWTDKIKFHFHKLRGGDSEPNFQLSGIKFFI